MVALNFKPEFVIAIDGGQKTRTIRRIRKSGNPKRGDLLQLFTGLRTKACEKIRDVTCTRVTPVEIHYEGIKLDGHWLYAGWAPRDADPEAYDYDFARADGFESFGDMVEFFEKQYGLPFKGQLIEWSLSLPSTMCGGQK